VQVQQKMSNDAEFDVDQVKDYSTRQEQSDRKICWIF